MVKFEDLTYDELQELAEAICESCKGSERGCEAWHTCEGFREEAEEIISEWTNEESSK